MMPVASGQAATAAPLAGTERLPVETIATLQSHGTLGKFGGKLGIQIRRE